MVYRNAQVLNEVLCQEQRYDVAFTNQRGWACVDELVLSPGWNDHKIASFDILIFSGNGCSGSARSEGKGLVNSMDLRDRVQGQQVQ